MYAQHFNFNELPFSIAPNPRYVYLSPQHREALAHLLYGISMGGGFVVLTGEVGTGKTTLCRCLLEQLPEDVEIAVIFNPRLNSRELLAAICTELRIPQPQHRAGLKVLIDLLNQHLLEVHARGKRTVVLIDEAQNLSFDVLEQIRLLTNLETNEAKLLQIILVGQPELNALLQRRNLRQLAQRITARYHLRPLSLQETVAYIRHRIAVSGGNRQVFSTAAAAKIYRLSGGIPRLINLICDRALLGAFSLGKTDAGCAIVRRAAAEVLPAYASRRYLSLGVTALAGIVAALFAAFAYFGAKPESASNVAAEKPQAVSKTEQLGQDFAQQAKHAVLDAAMPAMQETPFAELVTNPNLTRKAAVARLFGFWNIPLPVETADECAWAARNGWRCLEHTGTWVQLRNLELPSVMVFETSDGDKRYAMFSGLQGEKARLVMDGRSYDFAAAEILPYWQGDAILLWKPPLDHLETIKRGDRGEGVKWLRQRLSVPARPGMESYFDSPLQERVAAFQKEHGLFPDGIVGALTFIHLNRKTQDPAVSGSASIQQETAE